MDPTDIVVYRDKLGNMACQNKLVSLLRNNNILSHTDNKFPNYGYGVDGKDGYVIPFCPPLRFASRSTEAIAFPAVRELSIKLDVAIKTLFIPLMVPRLLD